MIKIIRNRWSNERGSAMMIVFFCVILLTLFVPLLIQVFGTGSTQQARLTKERNANELAVGNMEAYIDFLQGYTFVSSDMLRTDVASYTSTASGNVTNSKGQTSVINLHMNWGTNAEDRYTITSLATSDQVKESIVYSFRKSPVITGPIVEEDKYRGCATGTFILGGSYSNSQNTPATLQPTETNGKKPNVNVPLIQHYAIKAPIEAFLSKKKTAVDSMTRPHATTELTAAKFKDVNDYLTGTNTVVTLKSDYTFTGSHKIGNNDNQSTLLFDKITMDGSTVEIFGDVYAKNIITRNGGKLIVHGNIIVDTNDLTIETNHPIYANNLFVKGNIHIQNTQQFFIENDIIANKMTVDADLNVKAKRVIIINDITMKNNFTTTDSVDIIAGSFLINATATIDSKGDLLVARNFEASNSFNANVGGNIAIGGNLSVHSSNLTVNVPPAGEGSSSLIIEGGECKTGSGPVSGDDTPSIWEPTPVI